MAGFVGDIFGGVSYFDPLLLFRQFLVDSGFIWLAWVFVVMMVLTFLNKLRKEREDYDVGFGSRLQAFLYLLLAGVASWIASGNAVAMLAPIVFGLALQKLITMGIKKKAKKGGAEEEEAREAEREAGEEGQEEAEEEQEETEEEQEVVAERTIKNVEYNKSQVVQMLSGRMNSFQNVGYGARDAQFGMPVQNVILELLLRLINFEREEQGAAARMFGLEEAQDKIEALEEAREKKEKKLTDLSERLDSASEGFLKRDLPKEGRNTVQLVQRAYQLGQQLKAISRAQAAMQRQVAQLEPLEKRAKAMSEQNIKNFRSLTGEILQGLNGMQKLLQSAAPPAQVVSQYRKVAPLLGRSRALVQQHSTELKQLLTVREQELGAKGQELMEEAQLDELEGMRESILGRLSGIKGDKAGAGERGIAMQEIRGALNTLKPTLQRAERLKARVAQARAAA